MGSQCCWKPELIYWTWIWCCRSGNNTTLRCSLCAKLRGWPCIHPSIHPTNQPTNQPTIHHPSIHTWFCVYVTGDKYYREIFIFHAGLHHHTLGWSMMELCQPGGGCPNVRLHAQHHSSTRRGCDGCCGYPICQVCCQGQLAAETTTCEMTMCLWCSKRACGEEEGHFVLNDAQRSSYLWMCLNPCYLLTKWKAPRNNFEP